ncbi:MAG: hypothetical protein NWQ28_02315, partial [Nodularia sp. (in: cyanobacteria)]|nr:hypothetical protein [Nodularia sp. (in: cyanobacteria)]
LEIPKTDKISISQTNPVFKSIDEQPLISNRQSSNFEIKSTLLNSEKLASIQVESIFKQLDSIPEINETTTIFPQNSSEKSQNTLAQIFVNPVTPSSINQIPEMESTQLQQNSDFQVKSTLVNSEQAVPIQVETAVKQLDSIPEINEIKTVFPQNSSEKSQNTLAEISVNPVTTSSINQISEIESTQLQQNSDFQVKSTLVNSDQITPIRVEPVKPLDSIPEINEIKTVVPQNSSEISQNTLTEISVNPVKPSSINPRIDSTQVVTGNQPTSKSEVKSILVNSEKAAPIQVETAVKQLDSIPEINEIKTVVPQDFSEISQNTLTEISVNPVTLSSINQIIDSTQVVTGNQPTSKSEVKSILVNSEKIIPIGVEPVVKQLDSIPEINEIKTVFSIDSPNRPQNTLAKISEIDSAQFQPTSKSEIKSTLVNLEKIASSRVESLQNQDKIRVNDYIQNNLSMEENTSISPDSTLTQPQKSPELNTVIVKSLPDSLITQNIHPSDVVISQNRLPSASLSQKTASTIKPVVMTHPSSVYPQIELESRQFERVNQRQPVAATQTPMPTITVSIGRIEVKANPQTTSPKTSNKSTRKEPGLSLQDYLKQRQGGK